MLSTQIKRFTSMSKNAARSSNEQYIKRISYNIEGGSCNESVVFAVVGFLSMFLWSFRTTTFRTSDHSQIMN
jgi:hypothetical protein